MSTKFLAFRASSQENLEEQIAIMKSRFQPSKYREDSIDIQIFPTSTGIVYRVLEAGYGLQNTLWKDQETFPPCNYYDSVEVPESDIDNLAVAEEVDRLILSKNYQIIEIAPKVQTRGGM